MRCTLTSTVALCAATLFTFGCDTTESTQTATSDADALTDTGLTDAERVEDAEAITDASVVADAALPAPDAAQPIYAENCDDAVQHGLTFTPALCAHEITHQEGLEEITASCGVATETPVHLHLNFPTEDPSTTIAMLWTTGGDTRVSEVRLGNDPSALDQVWHGHTFTHSQMEGRRLHEVHVCGLEPGRTYYYQAGGPGGWSEVASFTTAPVKDTDEEFTFAFAGDTRSEDFIMWNEALRAIDARGVDMMLFSGDLVDRGLMQDQWDGWFGAGDPYMSRLPFIPANGNHDWLSLNYLAHFALPRNEENFHYRYGNALIISVNDFPAMDPRAIRGRTREYLRDTLAAHQDAKWKFVVNHRAFFSASQHGSTSVLQEEWLPFIDEYGVDMVFNGHDHNYERSKPIRNMEVVPMGEGTIYAIAAGIGAPLYENGSEWWTEISEKVPSYGIVRVAGDRLEYTAYRLDGTMLDSFTWTK
ncbi:MAG: fibronectin type III domain-containing protein [Bradymonadia bacterium]